MARSLIIFKITEKAPEIPCVFKLEIGKKFFIWKSPGLVKSLKSLARDLDRKIQGNCPETDLFYRVVKHIKTYKMYNLIVIPLFSTENMDDLIEFERAQLDNFKSDPDCLNKIFEPYLPSWVTGVKKEAVSRAIILHEDDLSPKEEKLILEPKNKLEIKETTIVPAVKNVDQTSNSFSTEDLPDLNDIKSMLKSIK